MALAMDTFRFLGLRLISPLNNNRKNLKKNINMCEFIGLFNIFIYIILKKNLKSSEFLSSCSQHFNSRWYGFHPPCSHNLWNSKNSCEFLCPFSLHNYTISKRTSKVVRPVWHFKKNKKTTLEEPQKMRLLGSVLNPDPLLHPKVGYFMLKLPPVSGINCQLFHEAPVEQRPLTSVLYNTGGLQ